MTRPEVGGMPAQTRPESVRPIGASAPQVVPELLRRSARLVPSRPAIVVDGRPVLTFAELEARANALAAGLRARGVRRGDQLALVFDGTEWPEFVVAYFGALQLGAATLLLGERFTAEDVRRLVARHRVTGVLTAPGRPPGSTPDCWVADTAALAAGQDETPAPFDATPLDTADVVFTSGTTALPRGVVASHANVVRAQTTWPTGPRVNQPGLHALPLGSVAGQIHLVNSIGGQHTLVIMPEFAVPDFCRLVEHWRVSSVFLVPAMAHWLVRAGADECPPLPSVRGVHFSGAPLPVGIMPDLPAVFPRATYYNFYSSTEAFPARVATQFDPRRPDSVGRPVGVHQVRITTEDGSPCAVGEVGTVWLRSTAAPARRFLDDDGAEGGAGFRDGWIRTGDLGHLDDQGYLHLAGRTDDMVNVGGFNVSTYRVEEVLGRHEAVAEAAVFAADHPVLGEIIAALVVPRAEVTIREIRQHAARQLTRRELPAIVRLVDDIPRNAAGKVVKRLLPDLLDAPGPAGFAVPTTELERRMARIWAERLDVGSVGVHDNFFEIGGDSLLATEMAAELRARLGVELDAVTIFEFATVAELARYVSEEQTWQTGDRAEETGENPDE
ncbi:AMP-binding protein [Plantactinospora sonchi]|uniref:AMP-binding protein n=1 Tax=Plantactinospora sonchi TaxID=1544735 RepID=A0ABU7RWN9_9ACTN